VKVSAAPKRGFFFERAVVVDHESKTYGGSLVWKMDIALLLFSFNNFYISRIRNSSHSCCLFH
jgi:hypothetical protein